MMDHSIQQLVTYHKHQLKSKDGKEGKDGKDDICAWPSMESSTYTLF